MTGALAFAGEIAAKRPLPKVRDIKIELADREAFFKAARATVGAAAKHFPAPLKCVDCVEAAVTLPFEEGMKVERDAFLMLDPDHREQGPAPLFLQRARGRQDPRRAGGYAEAPDQDGRGRRRRHHGGRDRHELRQRRHPGHRPGGEPGDARQGAGHGAQKLRELTEEGAPHPGEIRSAVGLILGTLSYDRIKDADIVIEAVFEEMGIKEKVFRKLDEVMKPGAILATNTSTLDVNKIAGFTRQAAGRDRDALLQPGQRHAAPGGRPRRKDRQGRPRHRHGARQEDPEDRRGVGGLRRLHREPDDRAVRAGRPDFSSRRGASRSRWIG